ncbi:helix-turn-helix domain-containing protein [Enterococcus sp. DIV0187]|uniref:helix-turn-helix domain-containing protein n=1 Tax=Enterococcus sp. DIV0187 TaxID=2774644 RepID=UPI003F21DC9B
MNRILILTKNLSVESHLQEQLQKLNYEVFTTTSIRDIWVHSQRMDNLVKSFRWIFLSETITEEEAKAFAQQFQFNVDCLVRIVGEEPSEESVSEWNTWHISDWILTNTTLERLREKLTHKALLYQVALTDGKQRTPVYEKELVLEQKKRTFPLYFSDVHFTKLEKKIICRLMAATNQTLSREQLCHGWSSNNINSKLSQLSSAITKIKKKVMDAYGIEDAIRTMWGKDIN